MDLNKLTPEELRLIREGKLPVTVGDLGLLEFLDGAAALGAGAAAEIGAGLRGLLGLAYGESLDESVKGIETVQDLAYNPRTYGAQKAMANFGTVIEPVATWFEDLVDTAGTKTLNATGEPGWATAAHTATELSPDLISAAVTGPFFPALRRLRKIPGDMPDTASTPPLLLRRPPEYTAERNPDTGTFSNIEQNLLDLKMVGEQTGNTKMSREQIARRLRGMGVTQGALDESGVQWTGGEPVEIDQVLNEVHALDRNYDLNVVKEAQEFKSFWPGITADDFRNLSVESVTPDLRRAVIERSLRQWFANEDVGNILDATQGDLDRLGGVLRDYYEGEPNADELAGDVMADVYRDLASTRTPPRAVTPENLPSPDQTVEIANRRMIEWSENPGFADFESEEAIEIQRMLQGAIPNDEERIAFINWVNNDLQGNADADLRFAQELDDITGNPGTGETFLNEMWAMFEDTAERNLRGTQEAEFGITSASEARDAVNQAIRTAGNAQGEQYMEDMLQIARDYLPPDEIDDFLENVPLYNQDNSFIDSLSSFIYDAKGADDSDAFMADVDTFLRDNPPDTGVTTQAPAISDAAIQERVILFGDEINNDIEGFGNVVPDTVIEILDEDAWDYIRENHFDEEYPIASIAAGIDEIGGQDRYDMFFSRLNEIARSQLENPAATPTPTNGLLADMATEYEAPNARATLQQTLSHYFNAPDVENMLDMGYENGQLNPTRLRALVLGTIMRDTPDNFNGPSPRQRTDQIMDAISSDQSQRLTTPNLVNDAAIEERVADFNRNPDAYWDDIWHVAENYMTADELDAARNSGDWQTDEVIYSMTMAIARNRSVAEAAEFAGALNDRARQQLIAEGGATAPEGISANQIRQQGSSAWETTNEAGERLVINKQNANNYRATKYNADGSIAGYEYSTSPEDLVDRLTALQPEGPTVKWGSLVLGKPKYFQENLRIVDESVGEPTSQSHFSDEGLIAHARASGRDLEDGTKVYFVDEVQSDAHKVGRRQGYQSSPIVDGERISAGAQLEALRDAAERARIDYRELNRVSTRRMTPEQLEEHQSNLASAEAALDEADRAYDHAVRDRALRSNKMSDIPLRDNKWINSTVAQALKHAVDRDMDGIAFANFYTQDQLYLKGMRRDAGGIDNMSTAEKKEYYDRVKLYQTIYTNAIPDYLKKLGKKYGVEPKLVRMKEDALNQKFKNPKTGEIEGEGAQHWYLPITPEMKKAIKEIGVPMYGKIDSGLLGPDQETKLRGLLA